MSRQSTINPQPLCLVSSKFETSSQKKNTAKMQEIVCLVTICPPIFHFSQYFWLNTGSKWLQMTIMDLEVIIHDQDVNIISNLSIF